MTTEKLRNSNFSNFYAFHLIVERKRPRHCCAMSYSTDVCKICVLKEVWIFHLFFLFVKGNTMLFYKFQSTHCFLIALDIGPAWRKVWLTMQIINKAAQFSWTSPNFFTPFYASTLLIIFWILEIFQADRAGLIMATKHTSKSHVLSYLGERLKLICVELLVFGQVEKLLSPFFFGRWKSLTC